MVNAIIRRSTEPRMLLLKLQVRTTEPMMPIKKNHCIRANRVKLWPTKCSALPSKVTMPEKMMELITRPLRPSQLQTLLR